MILLHMDGNLPDPLLHISIISDARLKPFLDKDLRAVHTRGTSVILTSWCSSSAVWSWCSSEVGDASGTTPLGVTGLSILSGLLENSVNKSEDVSNG
jgi:hypothetical protein